MSELISGKEALIAWHDGLDIQVKHNSTGWYDFNNHNFGIIVFKSDNHQFRLKPRTITINGIEVPAPFEPKDGNTCFIVDTEQDEGFYRFTFNENSGAHKNYIYLGVWRTEEEIKQVVSALRSIFK